MSKNVLTIKQVGACAFLGCVSLASFSLQAQQLEEVVVTARKVTENLQDVPIAVTAFTSDQLDERGLRDVASVSQFTPGFSFDKQNRFGFQGGDSRPVIRGMSQILGEPNASIFVDGIQYTDSILTFPFDIVDRVEVIKGPQAALFGRATFAGAVNLITKRGTNDFENKVSVRMAEYSEYEVSYLSRGPIIKDELFYTAHARSYEFGGFYRNSLDGERVGDEESINFDGSIEYVPSDAFNIRLSVGVGRDDDGAAALAFQNRFSNNCFLDVARQYYCGKVDDSPDVTQNIELFGSDIGLKKDSTRIVLQLEYHADNFTISSNTGYINGDQSYGYDVDLTANYDRLGGTFNRIAVSDRTEMSTELLIQSSNESRFQWLGGVYYYKSRRDFREEGLDPALTIDSGESRIDNIAVFGSLSYDFTDSLSGSVELRYAEDEIGNYNPIDRPTAQLLETKYDSVSPRVTLNWQASEDSMLYASYAKGNKPGYINANPQLSASYLYADEEESDNFEIGSKNVFGDGRYLLNTAVYYIDWDKQQLTTNADLDDGSTTSVVINAGKTTVKGIEVELTAAVTSQLTAGLGFSWTDAVFDKLVDSEYEELTGNGSLKGNQTPNSAQIQGNAYARYEFPVSVGLTGFVRGDYSYSSKKYAQVFNFAHTGDQNLINLKAGIEADNWTLAVFLDNVTDDRAPSIVSRFVDFENVLPIGDSQRTSSFVRGFQVPLADKRQFGITATYSF